MRCSVLADALAAGGWDCAFATNAATKNFFRNRSLGDHEIVTLSDDPAGEVQSLQQHWPDGCDLLVVDHYGRDADYEDGCRPWARNILTIDDLADRPHASDILLNQNLGFEPEDYATLTSESCRTLVGPDYALLRPQFAAARPAALARRRERNKVERILVSLGATDPGNATSRVVEALHDSGIEVAVDVVLGAGTPHLREVQRILAEKLPGANLHLEVTDMAELMAAADLAIGAAGSSSWERCCLGLPTLMLITAENQRCVAQELVRLGAAVLVGKGDETDPENLATALRALAADPGRRQEMAETAADLCDGRGVERVLPLLVGPLRAKDGAQVHLRCAEKADEATVLAWQQHPVTRRYSRNPQPPTPDEHHNWFGTRLEDPRCRMTIIQHGERPAGVLRLDTRDGHGPEPVFEISILIDPELQGRGIGLAALRLARNLVPGAKLLAEVLPENIASRRVFEAAGYQACSDGLYCHAPLSQSAVAVAAR